MVQLFGDSKLSRAGVRTAANTLRAAMNVIPVNEELATTSSTTSVRPSMPRRPPSTAELMRKVKEKASKLAAMQINDGQCQAQRVGGSIDAADPSGCPTGGPFSSSQVFRSMANWFDQPGTARDLGDFDIHCQACGIVGTLESSSGQELMVACKASASKATVPPHVAANTADVPVFEDYLADCMAHY